MAALCTPHQDSTIHTALQKQQCSLHTTQYLMQDKNAVHNAQCTVNPAVHAQCKLHSQTQLDTWRRLCGMPELCLKIFFPLTL